MNNAQVERLETVIKRILFSLAVVFISVLVTVFINFQIITPLVIPVDECKPGYDIDSQGFLFHLFYELDSGYNLDITTFNIVFTVFAGIAVGGLLSFRWLWKQDLRCGH